jgi:hypothetical protein
MSASALLQHSLAAVRLGAGGPHGMGRGLHSFPFPLNLSSLRPFPLNLNYLVPYCRQNNPCMCPGGAQVELYRERCVPGGHQVEL